MLEGLDWTVLHRDSDEWRGSRDYHNESLDSRKYGSYLKCLAINDNKKDYSFELVKFWN
jgi:hypothetical protein